MSSKVCVLIFFPVNEDCYALEETWLASDLTIAARGVG